MYHCAWLLLMQIALEILSLSIYIYILSKMLSMNTDKAIDTYSTIVILY